MAASLVAVTLCTHPGRSAVSAGKLAGVLASSHLSLLLVQFGIVMDTHVLKFDQCFKWFIVLVVNHAW